MPRKTWYHNLWLMVSLCLLATWPAGAATYTWNGAGVDSNWSTGGNWVGGNPPPTGTHDVVFINAGATSTAATADAAWGVSSLTFNNNLAAGGFTLSGSALTLNGGTDLTVSNTDGQEPVTIDNALVLTGRSDVSLARPTSGGRVVTTLNGNLSGAGTLHVTTVGNGTTIDDVPELVLSGLNSWTGSYFGGAFNTGPGGMMIGDVGNGMALVRFASPSALPTGNGGNTAYLAAMRSGQASNFEPYGFLLTGGATEQVYDPAANLKFMIGGVNNGNFPGRGLLGSTGGLARLEGTEVIVFVGNNSTRTPGLALRVLDGTLTLGSSGKPVTFQSAYGVADTDSGLTGAASSASLLDTTTAQTLHKVGTGTLKLGNVAYTELNGSTDKTSKFQWSVVEGAVRGLSNTDPAHTIANSLFPASGLVTPFAAIPAFAGGVYEIDNSSGNGSTFTAKLRAGGAADEISLAAGGGFSAYGNPVTVSLDTDAANDEILFNWYTHPTSMMVFGSTTANAKLTMTNPIDLRLSSGQREFRILDNPDSTADLIEFSGAIRSSSGAGGLNKTGDGTLILSGDNSYAGATTVAGGTLMLAGSGDINQSSGITVNGVDARFISNSSVAVTAPVTVTQGTIGGTGTLATAIVVGANVIQSPGNSPGNQIHTEDLTWAGGGTYLWEIADVDAGAGLGWDLVTVNAPGDFLLTATSGSPFTIAVTSLLQNDSAGQVHDFVGTGTYYWKILDTVDSIIGFAADKFLLDTSAFLNPLSPKGTFELRLGSSVPTGDASEIWLAYYQVPEPASAILLGLAALATLRRRR